MVQLAKMEEASWSHRGAGLSIDEWPWLGYLALGFYLLAAITMTLDVYPHALPSMPEDVAKQ